MKNRGRNTTFSSFLLEYSPAGTWRINNVIMTSKRRRFDVIMTLLLRRVPAGRGRTYTNFPETWKKGRNAGAYGNLHRVSNPTGGGGGFWHGLAPVNAL